MANPPVFLVCAFTGHGQGVPERVCAYDGGVSDGGVSDGCVSAFEGCFDKTLRLPRLLSVWMHKMYQCGKVS